VAAGLTNTQYPGIRQPASGQLAWNKENFYARLLLACTIHLEENSMQKTPPATLKLQQQKLLGFRILAMEQVTGAEDSRNIAVQFGGKAGSKIGSKEGVSCPSR
jgi:hypothetical protein